VSRGRLVQVNVSGGGIPKLPVEKARVGWLGLDGDGHDEPTVHGGPHRAVCLFGMEAIGRMQAEGHPLGPGSVGENLTTEGVDWSLLPPGTRVRVGDEEMLELSKPAMPCRTQRGNFIDGHFERISVKRHPADSRMYARVLSEGDVAPGDPIEILPPLEDSHAETHRLLDRLDGCEQESDMRLWLAAKAAGHDVRILDDGDLSVAASPDLPGPAFNNACGLRALPHFVPAVLEHYRRAGVTGWLPIETEPWEEAEPDFELAINAADVADVGDAPPPEGVRLRPLAAEEWRTWANVMRASLPQEDPPAVDWTDPAPHLLATRGVHVVVAEEAGTVVGTGTLHVHKRIGLLRAGMVVPASRGRGIQRALIAARARLAEELGCDVVTSQAPPGSPSERNLHRVGMERIWVRPVYRYDPAGEASTAA
jgi:MOSC domain-containing protein YiiM/GNAT superfamily N-acetyltransferase